MPILVFDLGGTHLRAGIADLHGLDQVMTLPVESFLSGRSPEEVCERLVHQMAMYAASTDTDATAPIVLAFPGPVVEQRRALSAPTLYGDHDGPLPDIAERLKVQSGRSVLLLNDVSAAAWGLSRLTTAQRFMLVTVSSGIGSKIFDRSAAIRVLDEPCFAGEIGHVVVDSSPDAPRCDCGARGHLGGIASGRGVERMARVLRNDPSLSNSKDVVPAILRQEAWALDLLRESMEPLSQTLAAVTMAVGLEKVFIMGGFAQSIGPLYSSMLNEQLSARLRYPLTQTMFGSLVELTPQDQSLALAGAAQFATSEVSA